ncbi:Unknown protein sequence [Pseudomonas coronafaciens pv. oryzae]|nr:Unknown protein sequence [Pseudomonas coronafaciens pv. oryzae]
MDEIGGQGIGVDYPVTHVQVMFLRRAPYQPRFGIPSFARVVAYMQDITDSAQVVVH